MDPVDHFLEDERWSRATVTGFVVDRRQQQSGPARRRQSTWSHRRTAGAAQVRVVADDANRCVSVFPLLWRVITRLPPCTLRISWQFRHLVGIDQHAALFVSTHVPPLRSLR